jgi:Domain of unknown function (DUF4145)
VSALTTDTHEPKAMALHCPDCDQIGVCEPRGFLVRHDPRDGPPERWTLLQCPNGHPLLVLQNDYGPELGFDDDSPYRIFPPQDRRLSGLIPEELRAAHNESRRCFHAKAYTAAVVMSGRLLEGACEKQGVKGSTLQKSLDQMKAAGIIDGRLAEWADTLRGVRNAAAHFNTDTIGRQDAEDALAYSEALLDYLYVLKDRFESMKSRRGP